MGAERKSAYIDEKNKLATAIHEVRLSYGWLVVLTSSGWTCARGFVH